MTGYITNLHPDLLIVLKLLEARLGVEITVNSGYRDPEHNREVGGVEGSEHTDDPAKGADILCKRSATRFKMVKELLSIGVRRIGIGHDFVHVGIAGDKPQEVCWTYYPE